MKFLSNIDTLTVSASGVLTSTLAPGTAPFTIASTTKVANLNVDRLDDLEATDFARSYLPVDTNVYGFASRTETSISFNGTSTFTLTDAGSGWSYYRTGVRYTISGNKTIDLLTVENPLIDGRTYYIYIDGTSGTLVGSIVPWTLEDTKVPVAYLKWNNTLTPKYWLADERHTSSWGRGLHFHEHFSTGTQVKTLGALTGYTKNSDVDGNKTFAIAESRIMDEDLVHTLAQLAQPDGTNTDYVVLYRTSASTWGWKASAMPFAYNVGNTNNWIQWDDGGTMTDATGGGGANTRWVNSYLVLTNLNGSARFAIIPGQGIFSSLAAAQAEAPGNFTFTGFPIAESVIVYQLTWTTLTSTSKGQCRLAADPKRVSTAPTQMIATGTSIDHSSLAGLQGGTTGEYYHLTANELTMVGSIIPMSIALG